MSAQKLAVIDVESGEIVNAVDLQPGDSARLVKTSAKSLDYFKVPFNAFAKLNTEEFTYLVGELGTACFYLFSDSLAFLLQ